MWPFVHKGSQRIDKIIFLDDRPSSLISWISFYHRPPGVQKLVWRRRECEILWVGDCLVLYSFFNSLTLYCDNYFYFYTSNLHSALLVTWRHRRLIHRAQTCCDEYACIFYTSAHFYEQMYQKRQLCKTLATLFQICLIFLDYARGTDNN